MKNNNKNNKLRDLILSKSVEIIAENGIRGLSFREVARRAKVSHQAPYHYFKNDAEILTAIAKDGFGQLSNEMRAASQKHSKSPIDALTASGIAYVNFAVTHPGYFRVMFQRTLLPEGVSISDLPEVHDTKKIHGELTKATFNSGVETHVGLEELTLLCWSTVHGIASLLTEGLGLSVAAEISHEKIASQVVNALSIFLKMNVK
jgi:AcrR family transcriptional regulator